MVVRRRAAAIGDNPATNIPASTAAALNAPTANNPTTVAGKIEDKGGANGRHGVATESAAANPSAPVRRQTAKKREGGGPTGDDGEVGGAAAAPEKRWTAASATSNSRTGGTRPPKLGPVAQAFVPSSVSGEKAAQRRLRENRLAPQQEREAERIRLEREEEERRLAEAERLERKRLEENGRLDREIEEKRREVEELEWRMAAAAAMPAVVEASEVADATKVADSDDLVDAEEGMSVSAAAADSAMDGKSDEKTSNDPGEEQRITITGEGEEEPNKPILDPAPDINDRQKKRRRVRLYFGHSSQCGIQEEFAGGTRCQGHCRRSRCC